MPLYFASLRECLTRYALRYFDWRAMMDASFRYRGVIYIIYAFIATADSHLILINITHTLNEIIVITNANKITCFRMTLSISLSRRHFTMMPRLYWCYSAIPHYFSSPMLFRFLGFHTLKSKLCYINWRNLLYRFSATITVMPTLFN